MNYVAKVELFEALAGFLLCRVGAFRFAGERLTSWRSKPPSWFWPGAGRSASFPKAPGSGRVRSASQKRGVGRLALGQGTGSAGRRHRFRERAARLADPAAQGRHPGRPADVLSPVGIAFSGPRRIGHRSHLAERRTSMGKTSAVCRRCAGPRSSEPAAGAPRSRCCWPAGGLEVQLGTRTADQAEEITLARENTRYLPGVRLPDGIEVGLQPDRTRRRRPAFIAVPRLPYPRRSGRSPTGSVARPGVLLPRQGLIAPGPTAIRNTW